MSEAAATPRTPRPRARAPRADAGVYAEQLVGAFAVDRRDGWYNLTTGIGTSRDKAGQHTFASSVLLSDTTLEALFGEDDFAQRICCAPLEEAFKRSFRVGIPTTDDSESDEPGEGLEVGQSIRDYLDEWRLDELAAEAAIWGRTFGGGAVWIGADDGRAFDVPLELELVRTINFLRVLDRRQLWPRSVYQGLHPRAGEVETYWLTPVDLGATAIGPAVVHESRLVTFPGARTTRLQRVRLGGWDDSVLRRCYAVLLAAAQNWQSIGHLMADLSQAVFGIKGLANMICSGQRATVEARLELVDQSRSVARAIAIDAEGETFERKPSQLAGVAELFDRTILRVAATAQMPVTVLMGQSPTGFDATGQADFQGWYDIIERLQRTTLGPRLRRIVRVLLAAPDGPTGGEIPERLSIEWPSLWQGTTKDRAAEMEAIAKRDALYVQQGILSPHEVALSRFPDGGWSPETTIDRRLRHKLRRIERAAKLEAASNPQPTPAQAPGGAAQRPQSPEVGTSSPPGDGSGGETDPERGDTERVIRNG